MIKATKCYIKECFLLIWMVFFRPQSLRHHIEKPGRNQIWRLIFQSIIVILLMPLPFAFIHGLALKLSGVNIILRHDLSKILGLVASGAILGVVIGVVLSIAYIAIFGRSKGLIYGITGVIVGCLTTATGTGILGIINEVAGNTTILVISLVIYSLVLSSIINVVGNLEIGLRFAIGLTASFTILNAVFAITKS